MAGCEDRVQAARVKGLFAPRPVLEAERSVRPDNPVSGVWDTERMTDWGVRVAQAISDQAARFAEVLAAAYRQRSLRVLWADRQARIVMIGGAAGRSADAGGPSGRAAQKDITGALADLTRAVSLDPRFAQAYYHRGMLHAQIGDQQAAISDYNRALSLDPSQTDGYYHRALLLAAAGNDQGAVRDLSEFLGRQGDHIRAHFLRGESYIALKQHRLALDDFTKVIQLDGNNAEAYEHRAAVKRHLGDSSAADDLARAEKLRERPSRERLWAEIPATPSVPRPDYSDLAHYHQRRAECAAQQAQLEAAQAAQRSVNRYMKQKAGHLGAMGVRLGW